MKIILKPEWFNQSPRKNLNKFVVDLLSDPTKLINDLGTFNKPDKDLIYQVATLSAISTCALLIQYLAVHPTNDKPWVCRKPIKHPLELTEFNEYIDDVKRWLNKQAPTQNYGSLVYIQAMNQLLNTMEITNG